jgi:hypothetical protein
VNGVTGQGDGAPDPELVEHAADVDDLETRLRQFNTRLDDFTRRAQQAKQDTAEGGQG